MEPLRVDPTAAPGHGLGLRERKKLRTRRRIAAVAYDLFVRDGFDRVTVDDVAVAADVSVKTVFNYFGTKEDLAFAGEDEVLAGWLQAIRHRPPGVTPLEALGELIVSNVDADACARLDRFAGLVGASAELQSRLRLLWDRLEQAVARVLVAESESDADPGAETDLLVLATARVEAARIVSVPRLFFGDEVRAYVEAAGDEPSARADAVATWTNRALATVGWSGDVPTG